MNSNPLRPLQNAPFASRYCGMSGSNFNPQNTQCMDACPDKLFIGVVKMFALLGLEQN